MENKVLILDKSSIQKKLQRMAFQIWEHNNNEDEIMLIGIEGPGQYVAQDLAKRLREISPLKIEELTISINKKQPLNGIISLAGNPNKKSIVLVDDVANSGKTLLYALKPILDFEPSKILIAVLLDRKHKSFPITPDIVGHSLATTLQEHILVTLEGTEITGAYLS